MINFQKRALTSSLPHSNSTTQYAKFPLRPLVISTLHPIATTSGAAGQLEYGVPGGGSTFVRPPVEVETPAEAEAPPETKAEALAEQQPVPRQPITKRYGGVNIVGPAIGAAPQIDFVIPSLLNGSTRANVAIIAPAMQSIQSITDADNNDVANPTALASCTLPDGDHDAPRTASSDPKFSRKDLADMIHATSDFDELTGRIAKLVSTTELNETERLSLRKFIAKKACVSVASLKEDAKLYQQITAEKDCNHLFAAREILKAFGTGNLLDANGYIWCWKGDGVWRRMPDREIKQKIHDVTANNKLTSSVVGSVLDLVKTEAHRPNHQFDENKTAINCANGELTYEAGAWRRNRHERDHYRTAILPVAYDPAATAPRFTQFLHEVFEGDADAEAKEAVVMEMLGYTLIPSSHLEKFLLLIGPGANGKSVLLHVVESLVGREHVCAVQPSQFENRFQRGHLQGRLANIITEIAEGGEIADAQLKSLVSGEMTTAEHKHQDPFDFVPYAKHWFASNHLPHTRDFSNALFRRAIILTFNNTFEGKTMDVHLVEKLKSELPGILNMALAGLKRLIDKNAFTECSSSIEAARLWRVEADQVAQFVEEECETGVACRATSAALYSRYQSWADAAGVRRTLNRNNFTNRLKRLGCSAERGTGGTRMIAGVAPRPSEAFGCSAAEYASRRH